MPPTLLDRLRVSAQLWVEAHEATFARLGREVINDGGFFARIGEGGGSTTTATLERFARFLGDADNWPSGDVPDAVRNFVHVVGVNPERVQDHVSR